MSEKYRKPELSEFVDGFKYEIYSEGLDEDSIEGFCGWYSYIVGDTCWRDKEDIEREIDNIRVRL